MLLPEAALSPLLPTLPQLLLPQRQHHSPRTACRNCGSQNSLCWGFRLLRRDRSSKAFWARWVTAGRARGCCGGFPWPAARPVHASPLPTVPRAGRSPCLFGLFSLRPLPALPVKTAPTANGCSRRGKTSRQSSRERWVFSRPISASRAIAEQSKLW